MLTDRRSLLVGVALGVLVSGCRDAPRAAAPAPPPPVVEVAPVVERDVPISAEWVGTLIGYVDAQIRARVSGHLFSLNYKEGSLVKRGDLLFQVDPRPYQTALEQAGAKLRLAESNVAQAKSQVSASQAQVEQARASVAQAEANVTKAEATQKQSELDVGRYTPAAARGSVSQQELDNAVQTNLANLAAVAAVRAALQNSRASVAQAEAALEKARADVETQQAEVAAVRAALADAQLNLGYTRVSSPIDGIAGFRGANIGDLVGPNDSRPLTTVSQVDPIYAEVAISEQLAYSVFRRWADNPAAAPPARAGADPGRRQRLPEARQSGHPRPAGGPEDRHRDGPGHLPEPRQRAAPRPVRQGSGGDRGEEECAARPPARRAGCAGRPSGGGGRRGRHRGDPAGAGRPAYRVAVDHRAGREAR